MRFAKRFAPILLSFLILTTVPLTQPGCAWLGWQQVDPDADAVLVNAERADQAAFATCDAFVNWEKENNVALREKLPAAHELAEVVRTSGPGLFRELRTARETYKATRLPGDAETVEQKLALVENWARQARLLVAQYRTK